jgi:hypothetical protein
MLGVDIAADGNNDSQFQKMKAASAKWADQLRTGRLRRSEVWLALLSTLWRSLYYPLPCTDLTKQQCEAIMAPALSQALLAMGVCRNLPRTVVHGPLSRMGLGILHIYSIQHIVQLKDIIHHTAIDTFTRQLYWGSLEAMLLEVGIGQDIFRFPYHDLQHLATASLIKSTWAFLSTSNLHLHHNIVIPLPRNNNTPIILLFYNKGARGPTLASLNKCRLFLKAFHLSDITDFSGRYIMDMAWHGTASSSALNNLIWPAQGKPSTQDWHIWRDFLHCHLIDRHRTLRSILGPWQATDSWRWFLSMEDYRLYEKRDGEWWYYLKVPSRTRRLIFIQGDKGEPKGVLHKAMVAQSGSRWTCLSHGPIAVSSRSTVHSSLANSIAELPTTARWSVENFQSTDNGIYISQAISAGSAIAVCDGSYKNGKGSSAWVLEGAHASGRITVSLFLIPWLQPCVGEKWE